MPAKLSYTNQTKNNFNFNFTSVDHAIFISQRNNADEVYTALQLRTVLDVSTRTLHVSRESLQPRECLLPNGNDFIRGKHKSPLATAPRSELDAVGMHHS